ncbi:helix-turn-helix transcriptional regulator [Mesorhizobium sp. CU2]|uniref:helix-turn-helix domain-containing protein n=1 Tax=unclassified Mesorhizobium TaxID=325217 RepID=UPI0011267914|nr:MULTISPECIES: AraC family transcriptional regulator [unclassified Mesorhizobium]TPN83251.1 helix-turn-helix transcriptional regulator [Mesorhizobium sp. CU3]TPO15873.1 helix-turn-helix transcriptional regulator [Mesorhizobium sp. CU2]
MAKICGAESAPTVSSRRLQNSSMIATRLIVDVPPADRTAPLQIEDGFIAAITFQDGYERESWIDGRALPLQRPQPAGSLSFMDLRMKNEARFASPVNSVQFYFPQRALHALADANELSRAEQIQTQLCWLFHEPVFVELGRSLLPAFERPEEPSRLFVDHVLTASALHLLTGHAGAIAAHRVRKGGLAPWQQRRVIELLDSNLSGDISLEDLATACKLSARHFTRAFTQSNGMPPHRWMLGRRVERAKEMMTRGRQPIEEIARLTSFANQSHFTRVFTQVVGESPAAWRRARTS